MNNLTINGNGASIQIESDYAFRTIWPKLVEGSQYFNIVNSITINNVTRAHITWPMWPHIVYISISKCCHVDTFPIWPTLETISLENFTGALPLWPRIEYFKCSSSNISIFPNWPRLRRLDCHNMYIKEIPLLPLLENISCKYCPNLTSLPRWPIISQVHCRDCPNLVEIPCWSTLIIFKSHNLGITKVPNWPIVEEIECDEDLILDGDLPIWPRVRSIKSQNYNHVPVIPIHDYKVKLVPFLFREQLLARKVIKKWRRFYN